MIILGIDPGPEQSAVVIWDSEKEIILEKGIFYYFDMLEMLDGGELSIFNKNLKIELMAIEVPVIFGAKVWQQIIDISFIAGYFASFYDQRYQKIAPNDWKLHITGKRGANDQLVKQALMARFGPKGTKKAPGKLYGIKSHMWDALGVAVYAGDTIKKKG